MAILELAASGSNASSGDAPLRVVMVLVASGSNASSGSAYLVVISKVLVTQFGVQLDAEGYTGRVTQFGVHVDVDRKPPVNVTQAGVHVDVDRLPPVNVDQFGVHLDVNQVSPLAITAFGVMVDARLRRPRVTTPLLEFHVETRAGVYLAFLDNAFGKAYLAQLSDAGSGKFTIHADDPKATSANLAAGNIVKVRLANVEIGAWVIESATEVLVNSGETAAELIQVSGRGLLGLLDKAIVYPTDIADPTTVERAYVAKTKAYILDELYDEYVARGGGSLTMTFTSVLDTGLNAWSDSVTMNVKAGQTLLDVARTMVGLGCEITVDPDRSWNAYVTAGTDRSSSVVFRQGYNVLAASRKTDASLIANAVLGEGRGLLVESEDATSIAAYGRREAYLSVQNTSNAGQVTAANSVVLTEFKDPANVITLSVTTGNYLPEIDYHLGDYVKVNIPGKIDTKYRVRAISLEEKSGPTDLCIGLELNSVDYEFIQRMNAAMRQTLSTVQANAGAQANVASSSTQSGAATTVHTHDAADLTYAPADVSDWNGSADPGDVDQALDQLADRTKTLESTTTPVTLGTDADTLLGLTGQQLTLDSQTANLVLAGPASGAAADPTFRALVFADIPKVPVVEKTADYVATAADLVIVCNKASAMTITLPAATGSGRVYMIKSIGAGAVTVDADGSETIDGATTQVLDQWEALQIVDNAAGTWVVV